MYQLKVSVEDVKYCGTFKITGAQEAAEKINNTVQYHSPNDVERTLKGMKVGEIGGISDVSISSDVVWVTRIK